jgi:hypothetical protein
MAGRDTASAALCVSTSTWGRCLSRSTFEFGIIRSFHFRLQLRASDDDDSIWFFSAPPSFLGDKSEAFGGGPALHTVNLLV